jgi:hypothetical protein
MSARRKTVSVTTGISTPKFSIENWALIEAACKFKTKFEETVRADINDATRRFLWLGAMEAKAIPSNKVQDELFDIASDAKRLRLRLEPLTKAVSPQKTKFDLIHFDYSFRIIHRLGRHFDGTQTFRSIGPGSRKQLPDFVRDVKTLYEILYSLEAAAKDAADATEQEVGAQLEGDAWKRWVVELHTIVTNAGMPATVSNDTDKRAHTATPFTRLVLQLQKQLPDQLTHDEKGLAKAIQRAVKHYRDRNRLKSSKEAA